LLALGFLRRDIKYRIDGGIEHWRENVQLECLKEMSAAEKHCSTNDSEERSFTGPFTLVSVKKVVTCSRWMAILRRKDLKKRQKVMKKNKHNFYSGVVKKLMP
jgi:hypothetical protein